MAALTIAETWRRFAWGVICETCAEDPASDGPRGRAIRSTVGMVCESCGCEPGELPTWAGFTVPLPRWATA